MPTYVYKFVKTGETVEVQQAFDEDALTQAVHPRTGRRMAVKKVFTPVGVTFKGGGFYKTDSRGKSSAPSPSSESTSKTPESTSSESKNGDSGSSSSPVTTSTTPSTTSTSSDSAKSATKKYDTGASTAAP